MRAVVFGDDREVQLAERPKPRVSPTGVLVQPSYIGICGTDLHAASLEHFRTGVVMGHEFSGRVAAVGGSATRFALGDLVVVNPNGNLCGSCDACRAGRANLCVAAVFEHGIGIHDDGGMAEFVAVEERVLYEVPPGITERQAAWVEPLATAVRAVRQSGCVETSTAVVVGAGPIGLLVIQVLRDRGVSNVSVIEPSKHRRGVAVKVGANHVFAPGDVTPPPSAPSSDLAFECSGTKSGFKSSLANVRPGGTVIVIGLALQALTIEPFDLVGKELKLQGSIIYSGDDFLEALHLLQTGRVDVDIMTTAVMPLSSYADAFRRLSDPEEAIKILLHP